MRDFRDAKAMAQTLRDALKAKSVSLTHSESLELVAKTLGLHDWNELSARIQAEHQPAAATLETTGPATVISPLAEAGLGDRFPAPVRLTRAPTLPPLPAGALPALPLRDIVLFPQMIVPLFVGRETSRRAVQRAMAYDRRILALTQKRSADDNPSPDALYRVGVIASVIDLMDLTDGTMKLLVKGLDRAAVVNLTEGEFASDSVPINFAGQLGKEFLVAEIAPIESSRHQEAQAAALAREVTEKFPAYLNIDVASPAYSRLLGARDPRMLADAVAPFLWVTIEQRQDLLETRDVVARLEKILALIAAGKNPRVDESRPAGGLMLGS